MATLLLSYTVAINKTLQIIGYILAVLEAATLVFHFIRDILTNNDKESILTKIAALRNKLKAILAREKETAQKNTISDARPIDEIIPPADGVEEIETKNKGNNGE